VKHDAPLSIPLLGTKAARRVDLPASRCKKRCAQGLIRLSECHRIKPRAVTATQPRANVILTDDLRMDKLDVRNDQVGLRIASPERPRLREFLDKHGTRCSGRNRSLDLEHECSGNVR